MLYFMDENQVEEETLDTQEEVETEVEAEAETEVETEEEDVETLKARLAKAEELANNYKIRAEKAEKKPKTQVTTTNGLSISEIAALTRANLEDEDVEEVLEYAKRKKISVSEALKTDVITATLAIKNEKRKSAQAVHTGTTRRPSMGNSDERLLENARANKMPESVEDMARLAELRLKKRAQR